MPPLSPYFLAPAPNWNQNCPVCGPNEKPIPS